MMRAFDWRDVQLVKTLSEHGLCLDSENGLTHGCHPLSDALLAYLMPGSRPATWVWRDHRQAAFGQLRHRPHQEQARLLFVAPALDDALTDGWMSLIDQLAVEAGRRGAHSLIAEVDEASREFEALRAAGYAVYARQSVWKMARLSATPVADIGVRAADPKDVIGISVLYTNLVPRLVQQVEPPPPGTRGYVLERDGELIAFLDVRRGPTGIWLDPYLHPEAYELSEGVVQAVLSCLPNAAGLPVYLCVRRYQDWLQEVLAQIGFELQGAQAMLVKRLTARVMEPVLKPLPVVDHQVTRPVVRARLTRQD
jgi:hypothetical protein